MEEISSTVSQEGSVRTLDSVGRLFGNTLGRIKKRFWLLVGIIIIPLALSSAGSLMIKGGLPESTYGWIFLVVGSLLGVFGSSASVFALVKKTDFAESYRRGVIIFFPMLWVNLLMYFAIWGGMVMLVIPGIMVGVWLSFGAFVLVDGVGGLGALLMSKEYIKGYWWAVFGRYLLLLVFGFVILIIDFLASKIFGAAIGIIIYDFLMLTLFLFPLHISMRCIRILCSLNRRFAILVRGTGKDSLSQVQLLGF